MQQAPADSAGALDPAAKEKNVATISQKDLITWGIALLSALTAFATLLFSVRLARKRKEAELRAEQEHKMRTEQEERQREVEKRLALLEASAILLRK